MDWSERLFLYCERGLDPSFWAEPFNALSNASFLLAAFFAWRHDKGQGGSDAAVVGLIALTGIIGAGSFLFHTIATRWAAVADVVPIGMFMLAYIVFALRRFAGANWLIVALGLVFFLVCVRIAMSLPCGPGLLPITSAAGRACLNGSMMYIPSWISLAGMAIYLAAQRQPAAGYLAKATVILAASILFRSIDIEVCALTELAGRARGTHAAWHLLNGLMIYALLRAAIEDRGAQRVLA